MKRLRFIRDFDFAGMIDRKNCLLCRVMGIRAFKAGSNPILVSEDAAKAAIEAGAAVEVQMEQAAARGALSGDELRSLQEALA